MDSYMVVFSSEVTEYKKETAIGQCHKYIKKKNPVDHVAPDPSLV